MADTARAKLIREIVTEAKEGLARYYLEFPDRLDDERAADALAWSMRGVARILKILDQYEIRARGNGPAAPE